LDYFSLPVLLLVLALCGAMASEAWRVAAQVWMTIMQFNDVSIRSHKANNGPAYDPNIHSFDDVQTVK
jgi:hypothetical protein